MPLAYVFGIAGGATDPDKIRRTDAAGNNSCGACSAILDSLSENRAPDNIASSLIKARLPGNNVLLLHALV